MKKQILDHAKQQIFSLSYYSWLLDHLTDQQKAERKQCQEAIKKIRCSMDKLQPEEKRLLEHFIFDGSYREAAKLFYYSESTLYRKINKIIMKISDDFIV